MVLLMVCVLSVVASSMLLSTSARYETTFQSASWQEAIVSAEGGVDLAMSELRKRVNSGPSKAFLGAVAAGTNHQNACWSTVGPNNLAYANYGHALTTLANPPLYLVPLTGGHGGEGNTVVQARVFVDVPGSDGTPSSNFAVTNSTTNNSFISQSDNPQLRDPDGVDRSRWWYRIRALGVANVSGPARPNLEKLDNRLRRFSLFSDWRTGDAVPTPQVSRLVEVLAEPQTNFRNALMADQQINLSNQDVLVDSYDSSKGAYNSSTNHGTMGNIATNGQLINANNAVVDGNALTNNGTVTQSGNVSGQQSGNFYQELTPFTAGLLNPAWSSVQDGGTVTGNATYTANPNSTTPTLIRLDGINLANGGAVININAPAGAAASATSYIKVYVQGDISTNADSYINVAAGVNAIIYFTGNVNLQGNGIFNNSMLARQLVLNGLQPPANANGTYPSRTINIATTQDFEGVIYAPNHDLNLALQAVPTGTGSSGQSAAQQLSELQADQNQAKTDFFNDYATYQRDMAAAGSPVGPITLTVSTVASNLALILAAPNGQTTSDLATLQAALNKVAQTQIQIESLQGTLLTSQQADHALGYNGIYGGFVGRTITVADKTHVHYDETLRTAGPVNHYEIVNWFEDNLGRNAVGGKSTFWW